MIKIFLTLILTISYSFASNIDKKIQANKKELTNVSKEQATKNLKVKELADKIEAQNKNISKLEKDIEQINSDIDNHQKLLEESVVKLNELKARSTNLQKEKNTNESQIVDTIIEEFSVSLALQLASENSLQELIDNEIYTLLALHSKDKVEQLNSSYNAISNNTKTNQKDIEKISVYINDRQKTKDKLTSLKKQHSTSIVDLEKQHKSYQEELKKVAKQQDSLKNLLAELNILKDEEIKKSKQKAEDERRKKLESLAKTKSSSTTVAKQEKVDIDSTLEVRNQKFAENLNVKNIGSSADGVSITKYKGAKTIAPLKSFKVVKNFGTYVDPVYKIKLFNESIVLQASERQSKVVSVLSGKVVYAKKNAGMLDNVVIIQHSGGIHTVYSHLDEISPTLVVGKWVEKGYVVGRVNNTLSFQVTKDSAHINPRDLIQI